MKKSIIFVFLIGLLINTHASSTFTDINNHWASHYIEKMSNNNFVYGYPDKTFRPDNNILKSEAYAIVNRCLKLKLTNQSNISKTWYAKDLRIATEYGYADETTFKDDYITRLEVANILGYLYNLDKENVYYNYFLDVDTLDKSSKNYVGNLLKDNILHGYSDFKFKPYNKISRAEFIKLISLCLENYNSSDIKNIREKEEIKNIKLNRENLEYLQKLIYEYKNLDLNKLNPDTKYLLNSYIANAERLLSTNPSTQEIEKSIKDIEYALNLIKTTTPVSMGKQKLTIHCYDETGRTIQGEFFINDEVFINGSTLEKGTYLLKITAPGMNPTSSYVTIGKEDKVVAINMTHLKLETKVNLYLGENLSCEQGNLFTSGERITIQINVPDSKEVDKLYVNGKPQSVPSDEYSFQIKEDTRISVTFKDIEE